MKAHGLKNSVAMVLILLLAGSALHTAYAQATYQSKSNGGWSSASTWQVLSGTSPLGYPDSNGTVFVRAGYSITIGNSTQHCAALTIDSGGTVRVNNSGDLLVHADGGGAVINGTLTMSSSGSLKKSETGTRSLTIGSPGKITINGTAIDNTFDTYSFDPNSTYEYTRSGAQSVKSGVTFGNLNLGGSGVKTVTPIPPDTAFRCAGTLQVAAGVTFDVSTYILRVYFMGDVINNGTIDNSVGITVLYMTGAHWINNGTYLTSTTPGFGYQPTSYFTNTEIGGSTSPQTFYDVVIQGNTTADVSINVGRDMTVAPGGTFTPANGTNTTIEGNLTNNGTYNPGTSTVTCNDTIAQTLTTSSFYNLIINNPKGVTLGCDASILPGGKLTLTNGILSTGSYTLTIAGTDTGAVAFGSGSITGTIARSIAPGATGVYRFFTQNAFVAPGGTGNPTTITATVFPLTNPPSVDTTLTVKRYYGISAQGAGTGFTYMMRLPYADSEARGPKLNYVLWENSGSGWVNMGAAVDDTVAHYVQQSGLAGFSNWTIGQNVSALPIQLASFTATGVPQTSDVTLFWSTISEIDNYGFYIERSDGNASTFRQMPNVFIPGHGTTLQPHQYSWTDHGVAAGTYYYRLKQVDRDGSVHESESVAITVQASSANAQTATGFSLARNYPNPFNPSTHVQFTVERDGPATLKVYNILGQEVATLFSGNAQAGQYYTVTFDAPGMTSGAYFAKLTSNGQTTMQKMLLMK